MFGLFSSKKKEKIHVLKSPVKGKTVSLNEVNDPTFRDGILGEGIALIPTEGNVYAPASGTIETVFETRHAVSMVTDFGAEILIHVGLDTVQRKGDGFSSYVKEGDIVKKGDLLLNVALDKLIADGYDTITPMLVCNSADYASVKGIIDQNVNAGDDVLTLKEN